MLTQDLRSGVSLPLKAGVADRRPPFILYAPNNHNGDHHG
jgi:hypothetical protein